MFAMEATVAIVESEACFDGSAMSSFTADMDF